jgi:hypothetical protein
MRQSDDLNELFAALALAQGEIEDALKDATNPHFKSRYADLASVRAAYRAPFSKHGLALVQLPTANGAKVSVQTILTHKSGQFIAETLDSVAANATPQAIGSTITYLRRYSAMGFAGIAPDDDDGNAGTGRKSNGNGHDEETIEPEQVAELQSLIASYGVDKVAFAKYCGVESLAAIPARDYPARLAALKQKAPKQ